MVLEFRIDLLPFLSGQFICGNKHCDEKDGLASYEASVPSSIINLLLVHNNFADGFGRIYFLFIYLFIFYW